jgi:hypothetical protein
MTGFYKDGSSHLADTRQTTTKPRGLADKEAYHFAFQCLFFTSAQGSLLHGPGFPVLV